MSPRFDDPAASAASGPQAPAARLVAMLFAVSVLTQAITYVLRPTATYRAIELGVGNGWLGVIGASFAVVPLALALPSGALTDRFGERVVALVGAVLLCLSTVGYLVLGHTVGGLVVGTVLLGSGQLLCVVAQQALVANTAPLDRFDAAFGRYTFSASLGQAVGPALIVAFGGRQAIPHTTAIFWACLALAVVLTALSFGLGTARQRPRTTRPAATAKPMKALLTIPGLPRALVTSCVILAAVDITLIYLPALGSEQQLSSGAVGLLLTLRAAASMVSRFFLGTLTRVVGRRRLLVLGTLVAALATAAVPVPMPLGVLAAVVVAMGFGLGIGQPVTMAWLAESAPPGLRGRSMSLRLVGNRAGQLLIPSAVGLLAAGVGSAGVLWATAAALGAVTVAARRITPTPSPSDPLPT